jgi:hypothetical protein
MRLRACHLIAVAILVAACRRGEIVAGVSDSSFVAAMADLRQLAREPGFDSTARARARQGVLQSRGLTLEQLDRAAAQLAREPERAADLWRAIEQKAATLGAPPSVAPASGTRDSAGAAGAARPALPGVRPRREGTGPR